MMRHIGFATYAEMPQLNADDALVAAQLQKLGITVSPVVWERQDSILPDMSAIIIRSCWNYHLRLRGFMNWIERVEQAKLPLFNPASVVRWNSDKHYLRDLAAQDVPIPRTVWIEQGQQRDLTRVLAEHELDQAVVKPAVSLSAYQTWRTSRSTSQAQQAAFTALTAERGVLIQEFVPEVTSDGELSFMFWGRQYSHAVRKRPQAGDFRVQADFGASREPAAPAQELVEQAQRIVELVGEPLLFARVDGINVGGQLVLMELELIDPVLFLAYDEGAPRRFAEAIAEQLPAR